MDTQRGTTYTRRNLDMLKARKTKDKLTENVRASSLRLKVLLKDTGILRLGVQKTNLPT